MRVFCKSVRGPGIAIALGMLVACNEGGPSLSPTTPAGEQAVGANGKSAGGPNAQPLGAQTPIAPLVVLVDCEKDVPPRTPRSKISVNGKNLQPGRYRARVTSPPGANPIFSAAKQSVGDEVEFDFDSQVDPGETPIPPNYIRIVPNGPDVRGDIFLADGRILIGGASVNCTVDN
jgi:hypothetical protein